MKLVFVTTGTIRDLATLKRATGMGPHLLESGHKVTIILMDDAVNRQRIELECPNVETVWFPVGLGAFAERRAKRDMLRRLTPDVVYICGYGVRNAIRSKDIPGLVVTEHCELGSRTVSQSWRRRMVELWLEYLSIFNSDVLVCASRYLEQLYDRRMKRLRMSRLIIYLPYAFGSADIATDEQMAKGARRRAQRDGSLSILYMGAIRKNYGAFDILDAAEILMATREDVVFDLIGEGPELTGVKEAIQERELGNVVTCHGYVPDDELPELLASADAFLAPMQDTPQDLARCPSKVFLYLSYRKPIVTCPLGEPRECLGDYGFYYAPGNAEELADAIVRALDGATGSLVNPELHTWKKRTEEFLDAIKGIPALSLDQGSRRKGDDQQ